MPVLYVKKLTSLNPSKYKYMRLDHALIAHGYFIKLGGNKTFTEWLTTEI